jgi:chromosome segregation ATPase
MEHQLERYQQELAKRDEIVATLRQELEAKVKSSSSDFGGMEQELEELEELRKSQQRMQELDAQLLQSRNDLAQKGQAERILNKSLKEALALLKPLHMHLEDAEKEKMEISKELRNLRKRFRQLQMGEGDAQSQSTMGVQDVSIEIVKIKEELEETVRQLEMENSQLHDALEDLSQSDHNKNRSGGGDAKLRQKFVELNSRYEVTQNKLEDAHVENHALVKALKQKELEDKKRNDEIRLLRQQFQKSESELHNAKAIARSALVKVEELTMAHVEQLSLSRDSDQLERELNMST